MMNFYKKIFNGTEIESSRPFLYEFVKRKKIITYVPLNHIDKVMYDMSFAGAGVIGNYRLCSFRMKGLGTFMPVRGSNPYSGQREKLSYEEEIRLEMECDCDIIDNVIDALLNAHPYDEPAYEIYDFEKRSKESIGYVVILKKPETFMSLVSRLNKQIDLKKFTMKSLIKKIAVINCTITETVEKKVVREHCDCILSIKQKSITINKL